MSNKNKLHIERLKKIRPFVNFDYNINSMKAGNISDYDKRKIKQYFDEINEMTAHPHYIYRPRKKDRKEKALKFANQKKLGQMKDLVFLPVSNPDEKPKLKFTEDGLQIETGFIIADSVLFDKPKLLSDPRKEVSEKIATLDPSINRFTLMCGKHESLTNAGDRQTIVSTIERMMLQYGKEGKEPEKWLNGVWTYQTKNQANWNEYLREKKKNKDKFKAIRNRDKRRNKTIAEINFALQTTTDPELRNDLKKRKNNLRDLLGK